MKQKCRKINLESEWTTVKVHGSHKVTAGCLVSSILTSDLSHHVKALLDFMSGILKIVFSKWSQMLGLE